MTDTMMGLRETLIGTTVADLRKNAQLLGDLWLLARMESQGGTVSSVTALPKDYGTQLLNEFVASLGQAVTLSETTFEGGYTAEVRPKPLFTVDVSHPGGAEALGDLLSGEGFSPVIVVPPPATGEGWLAVYRSGDWYGLVVVYEGTVHPYIYVRTFDELFAAAVTFASRYQSVETWIERESVRE